MYKVLLFDLDGTLLPNDFDTFIREYFKLLSGKTLSLVEPKKLVTQLLIALKAMEENQDSSKTNQQVFNENFFPYLAVQEKELTILFEEFYANDFAKLRAFTQSEDRIARMLDKIFKKGLEVVIATKPVFPITAIEQRLEWAKVNQFPYKLITCYEKMHFCKPNPKYYLEILELIGCSSEECLMIGNDVQEDLTAQQAGIKTFLLEDYLIHRTGEDFYTDYRGNLDELERFLENL